MLNPMSVLIVAYRDILYYRQIPDMEELGMASIISILILIVGYLSFNKLKRRFVEEL